MYSGVARSSYRQHSCDDVTKLGLCDWFTNYSGGTVCQLSLETSEFCRKYKLNIPRVSKWFPVQFYMYFQDFLSFLLYGWSAKQEHLATSGRNVV